ncbi:MAG: NAD(P)H-hydrate dehydratase [Nocardioidaceae bacterium]|nr:NAD(P)H-hydrate dehydratase [Nocardioidaceae bacterium]
MRNAYTVEDVRAAEAALMQTLPEGTLMQRAAAGLAAVCADFLGGMYGARVLLLVGSGGNGGDALYAGALMARRGARVEAVLLGEHAHEGGLAALLSASGRVVTTPGAADVVVDGIVGIGARGGLRDDAAALVAGIDAPVIAVDAPSGVDVDTGRVDGPHVSADVTVTFGAAKIGLFVEPAASAAGVVEVVDIGCEPHLGAPAVEVLQAVDVQRLIPVPDPSAHKYTRGVLGVVAGSPQYTGAGVLVVSAAVATGVTGMVRYEGASTDLIRALHPEVVIGPGQVQAWVVGSGLGRGLTSQVTSVLAERLPTVVDADGLRHTPTEAKAPRVLTPHAGELATMLDVPREQVEAQMLASAREAAQRWDSVVLLKGSRSVIAAPDGRVRVNATGVPWLATAGAGDVLSGVVGALLAAGLEYFDAASAGAWLHGAAASIASSGGPLTASSVVGALPAAIRDTLAVSSS